MLEGPGLHGARTCRARVSPAPDGSRGIVFLHMKSGVQLTAALYQGVMRSRRGCLGDGTTFIDTVEHVLSALNGLCIHDAHIQVWGDELPILDGSAQPWALALQRASEPAGGAATHDWWRVCHRWVAGDGQRGCELRPGPEAQVEVRIAYDHPAIGRQCAQVTLGQPEQYLTEVAPARTFGLLSEAAQLREQGLAGGATLENAVVFGDSGLLNPEGLRFADEPVRHKLLDVIGDLALLGAPLSSGRLSMERPSHALVLGWLRAAIADGALQRLGGQPPAERA